MPDWTAGLQDAGESPTDWLFPEKMRRGVAAGDGYWTVEALISAVSMVKAGGDFPEWLAAPLLEKLLRYGNFHARTLDEAFGVSRKGVHLEAKRRELEHHDAATFALAQLAEAGVSINDELLEEVGELYGIGRTVMADWWARSAYRNHASGYALGAIDPDQLPAELLTIYKRIKPA